MANIRVARLAFNRGLVSRLGLARADIKRLALAAEVMTNWVCRVLGSMMLRPGWQMLGTSRSDLRAVYLPFVFSVSDKAILELTDQALRVWINDAVVQRISTSSAITNGNFDLNLAGWTNADEAGSVSAWQAGGYMGLTGNGTAYAIERQQVAISASDQGKEHGLHIVIERGPVVLRVGSTAGEDDLIEEVELGAGAHSLAFTPAGASAWVEFKSRLKRIVLVDSCQIEAAGDMVVGTPWLAADITKVRVDPSADVTFAACDGYQQYRIERHATRSWSVVRYQPEDGPFRIENTSTTTIAASAISGNITLTASKPLFRAGHVGALFRLISRGQLVSASITVENTFTNTIRITGPTANRWFTLTISNVWVATVTLQRSYDEGASWTDVANYAANRSGSENDGLDNQDVLYRIGVKTGEFTSGQVDVLLAISSGSITGVARLTAVASNLSASAEVLSDLGGTTATDAWAEGEWSDFRGYPTAVALYEGRLIWAGRDKVDASVSDAFDGFDPDFEGDAGPIQRSIGSGPVDTINWLLALQRLILGAQGAEFSVRSSSLDEPLTPTNFNIKTASTQGSAAVAGVKVDQNGVYVQRGGIRIYELAFGQDGIDYQSSHLSALVPEIGDPGITKILVQRQPDTRLHFIRSDGTVAVLVFDKVEEVIAFMELETDGEVEDGVILPSAVGEKEDLVHYSVKRNINGTDKRFFEKWAFESECVGGTLNKQADCFVLYNQAASSTIGGLSHLVGKDVVVWDNGKCLRTAADEIATFTVSGAGEITVTNAGAAYQATQGVVGLGYRAPWQSAKLVELMQDPAGSLIDHQRITAIGLILADVHAKGLKFGATLTESEMNGLPEIDEGAPVDPDEVHDAFAPSKITFPGGYSNDARMCLLAQAPRPCTVLCGIGELEHHG